MWSTIVNTLEKVLLNPSKTHRYSPVWFYIKENVILEKFPEERGLPLESFSLLFFYIIAVVPYAAVFFMRGYEPLLVLQQVAILLGIGLVLGSVNLTLGLINMFALGFFNLFGSLATTKPELWLNTASLWGVLIIILLLLPPHFLPNFPHQKRIPWSWSLIYSLFIGIAIFIITLNQGFSQTYFWAMLVLGSLAALTPSVVEKDGKEEKKINGNLGWIAGIAYGIGSLVLSWQLYPLLLSPREPAWFNTLGHIAITILLLIPHIIAVGGMLALDELFDFSTFRWLLYLSFSFLILAMLPLPSALMGALQIVIFYMVSFPTYLDLMGEISPFNFINEIANLIFTPIITAFIVLTIAATTIHGSSGILLDFFAVRLPANIASNPLLIFIVAAIVFTLSGFHWSTFVTAVAAGISILIFTDLPAGITVWPLLFALVGAVVIGSSRILMWPLISFLMIRQSRQVAATTKLDNSAYLPIINLLETRCWPYPLGRKQALQALARHGYPETFFTLSSLKSGYEKIRIQSLSGDILTASSLADIAEIDRNLITPTLLTPIEEIGQIQADKSPKSAKVRRYALIIEATQKTIKAGPRRYGNPQITPEEIRSLTHLVDMMYRELRPDVAEYWQLYSAFPKISITKNKPLSQEDTEQTQIISATRFYLTQVRKLNKKIRSIEPFRPLLSSEEQTTYDVLLAVQSRLERFEQGLDYQERARILEEVQTTIANKPPATWLTIDSEKDDLFKQNNPWANMLKVAEHYLSQLIQFNNEYIRWATNEIATALKSIDLIDSLPLLAQKTRHVIAFGEHYGPMLDTTITSLERISKEATSALAFPTGYNRRLGLQSTLDQITELRQQLTLRFVTDAIPITEPLRQIGELLHSELFTVSDNAANAYRNPYIAGNPLNLQSAQLFKGREDLAQKIVNLLRSQSRPTLVLHGPRRMGKTSFLMQLPRLLPSSYLPIYLDMQKAGAQGSDAEFAYALAKAIYAQIGRTYRVTKPNLASYKEYPFTILADWFDEIKPLLGNNILLFTIDEFELIGRALAQGSLTIKVLDYLRNLMQHNENMILMFAGVQTIEALGPNPASYFISAYPVEISYLHPREAEELIRNPDPKAGKMPDYDDAVVAEILEQTLCQPLLVQFICSEIINLANEQNLRIIQLDTLRLAINRVLGETLYFDNIWADAGKEGQELLTKLVDGSKDLAEFHFSEKTILDLQQRRVIHRLPNDQYEIEIPLVQSWVRRKMIPNT